MKGPEIFSVQSVLVLSANDCHGDLPDVEWTGVAAVMELNNRILSRFTTDLCEAMLLYLSANTYLCLKGGWKCCPKSTFLTPWNVPDKNKSSMFLTHVPLVPEVPKTDKNFEERLIFKAFLLKFVNAYTPIFYVAFFKGRWVT